MNKYEELKIRYQNLIYLHDDYGNYGIIFHNFNEQQFKMYLIKYKYSEHGFVESINYISDIDKLNKIFENKNNIKIKWNNKRTLRVFKFNLLKFIDFLKSKNYDIGFMNKKEYDTIIKPRKKLIKPKHK